MHSVVPLALETPRLVLRPFEENDCDALHEMFSDEACVEFTVGQTLAHWQTWRSLAAYLGHWQLRGYGPYAVVEKATGSMVGPVGLWFPIEWPEPEIKWSLSRRFWGFGYATEAAAAVRDMAASVLRRARLISVIRPGNTRSQAVARRLGGTFEKTIPFRGGVADVYAYALAAAEAQPGLGREIT
jgi:RimJ/RimL family protein N-acetyltransferase